VCLSVREDISGTTRAILPIFVYVAYVCLWLSVFLWQGDEIPSGRGNFGENVPDKPNIPNNCELDWSMQRHTTWADA